MTSVSTDRRRGINGTASIKIPCIAASTANLTLSGEQTIDGIALVTDDRVLVKDQTDASENGIYYVDSSSWSRVPDFDGRYDVVEGTIIPVNRGTANSDTYWKITNIGTITIGTTLLTFQATTVLSSAILNDGSVKVIADFEPNTAATYNLGSKLLDWLSGFFSGDLVLKEKADHTETPAAGYGQLWVKDDAPCVPKFTDDLGTDYDLLPLEGTWTPVLYDSSFSASEGQTYSTQTGKYTKIGRMVFVDFDLTMSSLGTLTGGDWASIGGLPFTVGSTRGAAVISLASGLGITAGVSVHGYATLSTQYINLTQYDATTGATQLSISDLTASARFIGSAAYMV